MVGGGQGGSVSCPAYTYLHACMHTYLHACMHPSISNSCQEQLPTSIYNTHLSVSISIHTFIHINPCCPFTS